MVNYDLYPGTIGLAALVLYLVGAEHVNIGHWMGPVGLRNLSEEDAVAAIQLIKERGTEVGVTIVARKI